MRIAELEQFIRTSLLSLGARECPAETGLARYALEDPLAGRFGRDHLLLTFHSSVAAHHPEAELISAGSFMYDLILRLVREQGRAASGWLPRDESIDPPGRIIKAAPRLAGRRLSQVREGWGSVYLFTFRLGFHLDTPHERLYTVRVDLEQGKVRHDVHPWRLIDAAGPPPDGAGPAGGRDAERAFRLGWDRVEEEVARLTGRYQQQGEVRLNEEIRTIENYYRQLIDEERSLRELRAGRPAAREESDHRIELLKLEWDRRVAEEKRRFSPEVRVELSCALRLATPLARWRASAGATRREPAVDFWVDLHSGDVWPVKRRRRSGPRRLKAEADSAIIPQSLESPEAEPEVDPS